MTTPDTLEEVQGYCEILKTLVAQLQASLAIAREQETRARLIANQEHDRHRETCGELHLMKATLVEDGEMWAALLDWIELERANHYDASPAAAALDTIMRRMRDLEAGRSSTQKETAQ